MGRRNKKKHGDIVISHDCRLIRENRRYALCISVDVQISPKNPVKIYCGVDPGVRTLLTTFGNDGCTEYNWNKKQLDELDKKIKRLQKEHHRIKKVGSFSVRKRIRCKRRICNVERRKKNLMNEIHWKTINTLLKANDFIFFGDIKSHNIVKGGKNRTLNRDLNNLKFYQFKSKLLYKSLVQGKKVFMVPENHTTKTCSFCGTLNDPAASKVYFCNSCQTHMGRDTNASKNILMKGILSNM
jgi:IS605 OrfB family transposase